MLRRRFQQACGWDFWMNGLRGTAVRAAVVCVPQLAYGWTCLTISTARCVLLVDVRSVSNRRIGRLIHDLYSTYILMCILPQHDASLDFLHDIYVQDVRTADASLCLA